MSALICPTCGYQVPPEQCTLDTLSSEVHLGAEFHRVHGDCPRCGRIGVSYGEGQWDLPPIGTGVPADEETFGLCALCAQPVKSSHTRPFGPVKWRGWCEHCRAVSHVARQRPMRTSNAPHAPTPMAPLVHSWLDTDD